jgi:hypothetical protein
MDTNRHEFSATKGQAKAKPLTRIARMGANFFFKQTILPTNAVANPRSNQLILVSGAF